MQGSHPEFEHIPTARRQPTTTAVEPSIDEEAQRTAAASRTSRRPPTAKLNTRRQIHRWPAGRRATGCNASHRAQPSTMPARSRGALPEAKNHHGSGLQPYIRRADAPPHACRRLDPMRPQCRLKAGGSNLAVAAPPPPTTPPPCTYPLPTAHSLAPSSEPPPRC